MIKINLLPPNLRKSESFRKVPLPAIMFIVVLIVLILHIVFAVLNFYKKIQVISLNRAWNELQPSFKEVDVLKKRLATEREKLRIADYVIERDIYITNFLNKINKAVPRGLWLNRLSLSGAGLVIEGSIFSFGSDEVSLVNIFFNELKNDSFFLQNFTNFNQDSMQRRNIKEYEILDFLLTAEIKKEKSRNEFSN